MSAEFPWFVFQMDKSFQPHQTIFVYPIRVNSCNAVKTLKLGMHIMNFVKCSNYEINYIQASQYVSSLQNKLLRHELGIRKGNARVFRREAKDCYALGLVDTLIYDKRKKKNELRSLDLFPAVPYHIILCLSYLSIDLNQKKEIISESR